MGWYEERIKRERDITEYWGMDDCVDRFKVGKSLPIGYQGARCPYNDKEHPSYHLLTAFLDIGVLYLDARSLMIDEGVRGLFSNTFKVKEIREYTHWTQKKCKFLMTRQGKARTENHPHTGEKVIGWEHYYIQRIS